jgi:hypothetical protein
LNASLPLFGSGVALLCGCTVTASQPPGDDVRRAKIVAVAVHDPARAFVIAHYHGATVLRDTAAAPPDLPIRRGDKVWIEHAESPPRILGLIDQSPR